MTSREGHVLDSLNDAITLINRCAHIKQRPGFLTGGNFPFLPKRQTQKNTKDVFFSQFRTRRKESNNLLSLAGAMMRYDTT